MQSEHESAGQALPTDKASREKDSKEHSPDREDHQGKEVSPEKKKGSSLKDRLKYLEEKYLEVFKENSLRKEEITKLSALVVDMLAEIGVDLPAHQDYKLDDVARFRSLFTDAWIRLRKKNESERRKAEEDATVRQRAIIEGLQKALQDNLKKKEDAVRESREAADKQIANIEEMNAKIQADFNRMLAVLKAKEAEIADLKNQNQDLTSRAAEKLMERFDDIEENDLSSKLRQSSRVDELIRLQNSLEAAHLRIDELEAALLSSRLTPGPGLEAAPEKSFESRATQTGQSSPPAPPQPPKEKLEERLERDSRQRESDSGLQEAAQSQGYLKDLVVRYIVFEARRNEAQSAVLRRAILDVLKVDTQERVNIDAAISGRGGMKESLSFLKLFGGSG